jgi:N-acetylglutamate synthase-like GNAT family acetyltransferase
MSSLLSASGLPTEDLHGIPDLHIWLLEVEGDVIGTIALERYGSEGLLRSMAVAPEYRNRGLARLLVVRLEQDALADGVDTVVLLTQTAESFFERLGYSVADRAEVSPAVRQSAEFRTLCPASARCMCRKLR